MKIIQTAWAWVLECDFRFLMAVAVLLTLTLGFFPGTPRLAERAFLSSAYIFIWVNLLLIGVVLFSKWKCDPSFRPPPWRELALPAACSVTLTILIFSFVHPEFRVLADEANLIGVSKGFYLNHKAQLVYSALYRDGNFVPLNELVPQRPILFPFVVSLIHSLRGYSAYNGFLLNAITCAATLFLVAWFGYRLGSLTVGLIASVLMAAFPLFVLNATSSGYDLLNLFFLFLVYFQMHRFLEKPSALDFELLFLIGALASQCRHETCLIFLPILLAGFSKREDIIADRAPVAVLVAPFLFVPMIWQRLLVSPTNFKADTNQPFSLDYIDRGLRSVGNLFLNPHNQPYPTSRWIVALALLGLPVLLVRMLKQDRKTKPQWRLIGLVFLGIATLAMLQASYYMGDLTKPYQTRLGLIYLGVIPFAAAYLLRPLWNSTAGKVTTLAGLGLLLFNGLSVAAKNEHGSTILLFLEYRQNLEYLRKFSPRSTLIISDAAGLYSIHNFASVDFPYAATHASELADDLSKGQFEKILVIQHLRKDRTPGPGQDLGALYSLTPALEYNARGALIRISSAVPNLPHGDLASTNMPTRRQR